MESSSSPSCPAVREEDEERLNGTAKVILEWAHSQEIQRLRSDRQVGPPEKEHLAKWATICSAHGIDGREQIYAVLDAARKAADRSGQWRAWAYLTEGLQPS